MSISYYSNLIVEHFAFPLETVSSLVEKRPYIFAASRNIFIVSITEDEDTKSMLLMRKIY